MLECKFFRKAICIITENADGGIYTLTADNVQEISEDWMTACDFVPSNDAPVHCVIVDGEVIEPSKYNNFESVLHYLCYQACMTKGTGGAVDDGKAEN